jgi:hypothetical protein
MGASRKRILGAEEEDCEPVIVSIVRYLVVADAPCRLTAASSMTANKEDHRSAHHEMSNPLVELDAHRYTLPPHS